MSIAINLFLAVATITYPFLVYSAIEHLQPKHFALLLAALFFARFLLGRNAKTSQAAFLLLPVLLLATWVWQQNSELGLRLYPVLINALMLLAFASSLWQKQPLIERLARLSEPDLPPAAIAYTRTVTQIWCVFFCCNGLAALYTALYCDLKVWSLYNGLIAYLLMGLLFLIEFLVRLRVKKAAL